jgi:hypothetical protein
MSSHESFYRTVKEAGGVLDPSAQVPPLDWVCDVSRSTVEQMRDSINKRSDILWPLGDIRTELVSNPTFNAFAHHDQGDEGIAVFSGLFLLLFDLSCMLWSHSAFLKQTHPTENNHKDLSVFIERVSPLLTELVWDGPMGIYTTDQERAASALNTTLTAYIFVCLHEVGHLVRAHIPYLQHHTTIRLHTLLEHKNSLAVSGSTAFQTLEVDADVHAARSIVDLALTTWNMGYIFSINFPITRGTLSLYVTDLLIGIALAFFCMDIPSRDSKLQSAGTHPMPVVRLGATYLAMLPLLRHPFKISREEARKSFVIAFQEIKNFWTILQLPARTFESDLENALMQSVMLLEHARSLDAKLRAPMDGRLRRLGTSMEHYDQFASFYTEVGAQKTSQTYLKY